MTDTQTPEQIQKHYDACMDSVNLLAAGKPEDMEQSDWAACVARNKEHIQIMLAKDFWTDQDLTPLQDAVK